MAGTTAAAKTIVDRAKEVSYISYRNTVEPLVEKGIVTRLLSEDEFYYVRESHQLPWPVWFENSKFKIEYDHAMDHLYTRKKSCQKDFKDKTFSEIFYS